MTKEMAIDILRGGVLGTNEQTHEAVFMAIKALKEQVEVVRCKDCRWNTAVEWVHCALIGGMFGRTTDNYCSLGERKDDDSN